jgi:hypothetical protein
MESSSNLLATPAAPIAAAGKAKCQGPNELLRRFQANEQAP